MRGIRIACVLAGSWLVAASALAEPIGFVAALRGRAQLGQAEHPFVMATIDREISTGDVIETHAHGWLKILLRDDTILAVDAESRVVLHRFATAEAPTRIDLLRGQLRTRVAEGFGRLARLELQTPNATVIARGTEWLTWFADGNTWVCAVRGEIDVRGRGASPESEALRLSGRACGRVSADGVAAAVPQPTHLRPVAMRPGQVEDRSSFPARPADFEPRDRIILDANDQPRERIEPNAFPDEGTPPAATAVP